MIVVSLTSWIKRIGYVKKVVQSIMDNTVQPDRVYLNLSRTEFNGVELPSELTEYFSSDDRLIINWVDGENTKSMKKIFPILKYLSDDDIIIDADDDKLFPKDLIESRIKDFERYGRKYPITSNGSRCGIGDARVISPLSLFQKKMLNNWEKYVNTTVIRTYNDDRTYLYILFLNGYVAQGAVKYSEKELNSGYDLHLDGTSMRSAKLYPIGKRYDEIVADTVFRLTHKSIKESFGFFNKNRYDCVMVYGKSGVNSKEMTCGEHLEIEYVIASLMKYCKSWCGRIFIVGSEPPESIRNNVIHVPCDNPYKHCKDANIIHKLRYACEHIPDLTDDFLMISDDQIVTKESSWNDMRPRIVRKFTDWLGSKWDRNRKIDGWHENLYQTLRLFPKDKASFWEPHIWSPMNKKKFVEMCRKYDYTKSNACICQSLYYNYVGQPVIRQFDHIHLSDNNAGKKIKSLYKNIDRHLSWSDKAFAQNEFRDILDIIVGFSEGTLKEKEKEMEKKEETQKLKGIHDRIVRKDDNGTQKKVSRITQLRADIASGRVIKVPVGDGYVWRKVK